MINILTARSIQFILMGVVLWVLCVGMSLQVLSGNPVKELSMLAVADGLVALAFTGWGLKLAAEGR
ncbi:MAG: hypothetical protein ACFBZ8_05225 [Opitutales bacterium]